jgi:hypothetical protein
MDIQKQIESDSETFNDMEAGIGNLLKYNPIACIHITDTKGDPSSSKPMIQVMYLDLQHSRGTSWQVLFKEFSNPQHGMAV